jgi:energy-converting hydrogenase B subunit D
MIWQLDIILLVLTVISAVGALAVKDLLASTILMGAFSLFMCLLWVEMGAVDVAFTEASVGAGITTILFVIAVYKTERKSKD